jgi:hypothetical protein
LPAGSYVAISVACSDGMDPALIKRLEQVYMKSPAPMVLRTEDQIDQLFEGLDLIEPGIVNVNQWQADEPAIPIRVLGGAGTVKGR